MRPSLFVAAALVVAGTTVPAASAFADDPDPKDPLDRLPTHEIADAIANAPAPDMSKVPGAPGVPGLTNSDVNDVSGLSPAAIGTFGEPFAPPGPDCDHKTGGDSVDGHSHGIDCKPAAVSTVVLPNNKVLYWNGLEGMEDVDLSVVAEFGDKAVQDQTRVLDLSGATPTWSTTNPSDGGADGTVYPPEYMVPMPSNAPAWAKSMFNDPGVALGALFCSDQLFMANGDVLVPGGTHYYSEPHVPGTTMGVAELEGLRNTRIYHPGTNSWTQSGLMSHGRWYPTIITMGDGKVLVGGGVTKLIKPGYRTHATDSLQDVRQTETYDPATGKWTDNGKKASHSLPLYPRLHLLPNGHVYYDAAGQVWGPAGQSIDEALWSLTASYDPKAKDWRYLGAPAAAGVQRSGDMTRSIKEIVAALNSGAPPRGVFGRTSHGSQGAINALTNNSLGFRGSTFSIMLPLKAPYTKASFLAAGGTMLPSPGTYFANASSVVSTVDTTRDVEKYSSAPTGPLNNARWFSTGSVLPTGQVIAFNGSNRDDVVAPGDGFPVRQAELYDPATKTWSPLASTHMDRTYHNTAVLLPSGKVLIGGNAPISNSNMFNHNWPGGFNNNFRDPSFELYSPPYLFWGPRPTISSAPSSLGYGQTITIGTPDAATISKVMMVRNTALTHTLDADQRAIELPVVSRSAGGVTVKAPPNGNVAPAGPYLLFIDKTSDKGLIPSVGAQVFVGSGAPAWSAASGAQGTPASVALPLPTGDAVTAAHTHGAHTHQALPPAGTTARRLAQATGASGGNTPIRLDTLFALVLLAVGVGGSMTCYRRVRLSRR